MDGQLLAVPIGCEGCEIDGWYFSANELESARAVAGSEQNSVAEVAGGDPAIWLGGGADEREVVAGGGRRPAQLSRISASAMGGQSSAAALSRLAMAWGRRSCRIRHVRRLRRW